MMSKTMPAERGIEVAKLDQPRGCPVSFDFIAHFIAHFIAAAF
jgi:hypothetical protein